METFLKVIYISVSYLSEGSLSFSLAKIKSFSRQEQYWLTCLSGLLGFCALTVQHSKDFPDQNNIDWHASVGYRASVHLMCSIAKDFPDQNNIDWHAWVSYWASVHLLCSIAKIFQTRTILIDMLQWDIELLCTYSKA